MEETFNPLKEMERLDNLFKEKHDWIQSMKQAIASEEQEIIRMQGEYRAYLTVAEKLGYVKKESEIDESTN